jgi:hypothetical protein
MATKVSKLRKCSMKTLVFHFCIPNSKHKLGAHWNRPAAAVGRNSPLRPVKALLHQPEFKRRGPKRRASIMIAFRTSMNTTNKKGAIVLVVLVTRPHLEEYFQTVM